MKKIFCLLLVLSSLVCFAGCDNKTTNITDDEIEKIEDILNNDDNDNEDVLLDFDNFYFKIKGIKFENFATYGKYLELKPDKIYTDVATSEECTFTVKDGDKANNFSLSFYYDGIKTDDKNTIVSEVFVYNDAENPLDISFAQGVKFGDTANSVLKKYGKPHDTYKGDDGKIKSIEYVHEEDWITIEFEFNNKEKFSGFRVRYDYDNYLSLNK